jgi:xanthine dehydrogenase accessory factor
VTMSWLTGVTRMREHGEAGVLVTVVDVHGHAPRAAGAKMAVSSGSTWGSVGGGNLESVAVDRAREMVDAGDTQVRTVTFDLSDKASYQHGVQCCGGRVTVLLEPLPARPVVAVFGVGHVGLELARILARHDLRLHLVDSRPEQLDDARLAPLSDAEAVVEIHRVPVLPELVLGGLPAGARVLVMTHDHAEDYAVVDAALRTPGLGPIGLIGSSAKWARFRRRLLAEGGFDESDLERVNTPIGLPGVEGKEPAVIAVSVAAALLQDLRLVSGVAP